MRTASASKESRAVPAPWPKPGESRGGSQNDVAGPRFRVDSTVTEPQQIFESLRHGG